MSGLTNLGVFPEAIILQTVAILTGSTMYALGLQQVNSAIPLRAAYG